MGTKKKLSAEMVTRDSELSLSWNAWIHTTCKIKKHYTYFTVIKAIKALNLSSP